MALPFTEVDVVTQPLYDEPFVVLLPTNHMLANQSIISGTDLEQENVLLLGEGHCFREQILDAFPAIKTNTVAHSKSIQTATEGSSLETLRHMVASGMGLTILPASAAASHYKPDTLVTRPLLQASNAKRTVGLAWRASFPRHKAVDVLRLAIQKGQYKTNGSSN